MFAYECIGLTGAIERLTDATRQSNAVALRRAPVAIPTSAQAPAPSPVPPLVPSPQAIRAAFESDLRPAIIREGDFAYLIDRRLIDLVLEEQASLMASVRVVPSFADGRTYARLYGARPDSLLGMLGFHDGDYLESINGFDLSSPERALEAYARLRAADMLEVNVRRGGRIVTLHYRVW